MAFSFGNSAHTVASAGGDVQTGADLEDIQTENIYFRALSGSSKIQLLPTPWPADQLPPATSSLMGIASQRGLVAAAGPDAVILATTESVRKAFEGSTGDVKPFQAQLKLQMPMRISQLAFSADEQYLVLSAETGGGLAVYEAQALLQGNTQPAFQISTESLSLRALVPNPTPEKGELFALVTTDGKLMMANLKEKKIMSGPNGAVLKDGVSCISWSAKGKQLVAGLGDGTGYQLTPEGEGKAQIPRPPNTGLGEHVSSITWLENNMFLVVHTPSQFATSQPPASTFNVVTRQTQQQKSSFTFQKIADPAGPYGLNRSPPHHFLLRLRDFPPNLQDLIIVASTASADIGLFSRSKVPLTSDKPADKITGVFTMTEMSDDSRRAALPITADLGDTSPIGVVMDLSSKETVEKPITGDEMNESPFPVPALMVLNNEGVLAAWWIVYLDSIRQSTVYPGLVVAGGSQTTSTAPALTPAPTTAPAFGAPTKPSFGSSTFGSSSSNGSPFAAARPATSFGAPALSAPSAGAFGAPSGLGKSQSPWGATTAPSTASSGGAAFGSSTFGSTPAAPSQPFGAPTFGATSTPTLGNRASPWATGGGAAPAAAFGKPGGLGTPAQPFGSSGNSGPLAPASSGFAQFASKGGFGAAANAAGATATGSIFGAQSSPAPNPFSSTTTNTSFGSATAAKPANPFGSSGFVLNSSFQADPSVKEDDIKRSSQSQDAGSLFGNNFNNALGEAAKTVVAATPVPETEEADMDADDDSNKELPVEPTSTTPISTPAAPKPSLFGGAISSNSGLFGNSSTPSTSATKPISAGFGFGQSSGDKAKLNSFSFDNSSTSTTPGPKTPALTDTPAPAPLSKAPVSPVVKEEPALDTPAIGSSIPEAPLPPDTTSKASYAAGDSTGSSSVADAPLPPDFILKPKKTQSGPDLPSKPVAVNPAPANLTPPVDVPGGPEDDGSDSGFLTEEGGLSDEGTGEGSEEGSGEDVAQDVSSPASENNQTPAISPESSFGALKTTSSPENNTFMKVFKPDQSSQPRNSLFGEINRSAPILLPTKVQISPRSPSPVRNTIPGRLHRPEASRSSSAPGFASQFLGSSRFGGRPNGPVPNTLAQTQEELQLEGKRRQDARARKDAEEKQSLVDEDDENIRKQLSEPIVASKILPDFEAHVNYDGKSSMESVPAQVEAVYRDINRMVDTLGLNARAMKGFIEAHTDQGKEEGRTRPDLEREDDWCLDELEKLSLIIERDLTQDLETCRVRDRAAKFDLCDTLQKELNRLRAKAEEIRRTVDSHLDPDTLAFARAQPLNADQAVQQTDLRRSFTTFQKLLSEAEEALSVLKAKTVSQTTSNRRNGGSAAPTVEAVMRTITKMTAMAEKRSGDIDVLEGQMRRLRFGSIGSREGSPFTSPQASRASVRNFGAASSFYAPDSIKANQRLPHSLMSSVGSRGSPPRKKLSGYTAEEKKSLRARLAQKKDVTDKLKAALKKNGTHVRLMADDEE
ncbi:hypothetical protein QTJ16_003821 [Diplocarpon rosae]|uniref:Nucleoporin Nup159/Nup146 N-terminal domain-containing protein n=1 Tax=Diplocarpon rosae TaxID=946125 RepID=A0AAD9SZJ5_9HELO|nr:hypothetical protein QTJ16_003821 [Diplocarpon rosae]PBP19247.1 hypothetical protein BUE80_DR009829 [Diplocarpon rosae]